MAISDKLQDLIDIKQDIKEAIENKGVDLTAVDFGGYAEKIDEIPLPKEEETRTLTPDFSSGNVVVSPDAGKVLTQVTVVKDSDLVPENIVKGVNIFGVVGTVRTAVELTQAEYDALKQGETWLMNETLINSYVNTFYVTDISFTSNGQTFNILNSEYVPAANAIVLFYNDTPVYSGSSGVWIPEAYRTVTFETAPTGDLLTWLQANAVKQTDEGYDDNTYYLIVEEE